MAEVMREVSEIVDLTGAAELYPGVRKIAVDMPSRTAYVFVGQSNRALTVTGEEFDKLVKVVPTAAESAAADAGAGEDVVEPQVKEPPAPPDVEPVEAIISVVTEPVEKTAAKGKGKQ